MKNDKHLGIRIPAKLKKLIQKDALRQKKTPSELVRIVLELFYNNKKEGTNT